MNIEDKKTNKKQWWKNNWLVIATIIIGVSLITLGFLTPVIFNLSKLSWLAEYYSLEDGKEISQNFANYFAPFIGLLGVVLTFAAFYIQYRANIQVQKQFEFQKTSEHFYKMLDIHKANVEEFEIDCYDRKDNDQYRLNANSSTSFEKCIDDIINSKYIIREFKDYTLEELVDEICGQNIKPTSSGFNKEKITGRHVFTLILIDLHLILELISTINKEYLKKRLCKKDISKLAYKIFFWGTNSSHIGGGYENEEDREFIRKMLNHIKKQFENNKGAKYNFTYTTNESEKSISVNFIPFSGHSTKLAHYYRHLYQTVCFLHQSFKDNLITSLELKSSLKTLRAQLMNEEVLLLYYNYAIGFGGNWERNDKNYDHAFFTNYDMIHKIPLRDYIHEFVKHPTTKFNNFIKNMQSIDESFRMFEWDEGSQL